MSAERLLQIATKAGPNVLVVQRFSGYEELSRLFEYDVELVSERSDIRPTDLLGTNATVSMELAGGRGFRHFNGYISRFQVLGETRTPAFRSGVGFLYRATLSPWLWFLTRTSTCQVFQEKNYKDTIQYVFNRWNIKEVEFQIQGETEKFEYQVQYRETDFNFVSRLLEQTGLYYYFTHIDGKHKLQVVNNLAAHKSLPGHAKLDFKPSKQEAAGVRNWRASAEVQPGAYVVDDFNPLKPRVPLLQSAELQARHPNAGFEIYDFPGEFEESAWGQAYAKIRVEELFCRHETAQFSTDQRGIQVGFKFELINHPIKAENREYLVIGHRFSAINNLGSSSNGPAASFDAEVTVIPAKVQFRPARVTPKPIISGVQTAIVMGPAGEEIYTDAMGRIRVRFHWDRYAKGNESDSCWLRVSQAVAGKGWGAIQLPRVGQEVLVAFLEGDPDRPIVTGAVTNGNTPPPYKLPDHKTRSGLLTRSYKGGNDQFNEFRLDDKSGAEQVYLQAQRNLDIRVKADQHEFVGGRAHRIVKKDQFVEVRADQHSKIAGDDNQKIGGNLSFTVGQATHLKGQKLLVDEGMEIHLKAGMKLVLEAGMQISLKAGANFVDIGPAGITIQGALVKINSGGSAGSGSGASPISPSAAKEAISSHGGKADEMPPKRTKPKAYGPQASSFKTAAKAGVPFCAVCSGC